MVRLKWPVPPRWHRLFPRVGSCHFKLLQLFFWCVFPLHGAFSTLKTNVIRQFIIPKHEQECCNVPQDKVVVLQTELVTSARSTWLLPEVSFPSLQLWIKEKTLKTYEAMSCQLEIYNGVGHETKKFHNNNFYLVCFPNLWFCQLFSSLLSL